MKPINIETLLSHSTGISDSYYRPTENDLLEDYLRSVECLTIDNAKVQTKRVEDESSYEGRCYRKSIRQTYDCHDKTRKIGKETNNR